MSDDEFSGSEPDYSCSGTRPISFDNFTQWQAHIGLNKFGERLRAAATAIFPNDDRSRYSKVYVLMIHWENEQRIEEHPKIPATKEISNLNKTFRDIYHFDTEIWTIPEENCQLEVNQKITDFVRLGGDSHEHLKIVYYAGHSRLTKSRQLAWTSKLKNSGSNYPVVQWSGIQNALEQALSDILVLLDCSHTGSSSSNNGKGITELIAARAYNPNVDSYESFSFTKTLDIELQELSKLQSFSVGNLYQNVFCRIQSQMADVDTGYPPPLYLPLSQDEPMHPRSIRLSIQEDEPRSMSSPEGSFEVQHPDECSPVVSFQTTSAINLSETPRIAFAIRLKEDFKAGDLSSSLFLDWLRNIPAEVADVKIEAGFHSYSSLLVVSMPVAISLYMPKDPAVINLGPVTSFNQVLSKIPMPNGLPTPNLESGSFITLPPLTNGARYGGHPINEMSGNGVDQTGSEMRFRKRSNTKNSLVENMRPTLHKGRSSEFSIASSISDPQTDLHGFQKVRHAATINGIPPPPKTSHRVPPFDLHPSATDYPQSQARAKIHTYKDNPDSREFPRISRPVELLRNSYDTIVIGSGYGGAVAASRMARAGQSVCLLERGKEKWPGEYPSGFLDAMKQLHVSGNFAPGFLKGMMVEGGDPTGMYHLICGKGQNAFVGNGLGGTSLLNANVFIEADDRTMEMECWPEELRKAKSLDKYYKRAEGVLEPAQYPKDWPGLPKLRMLERQAQALGCSEKFSRVRQTTRFTGGPNSTGVEMYPSALTGMDSTGVNDGSKSSTLVNYLSDAWNWGAEMFCECEARYIKEHPDGGYIVFFAWHGSKRAAFLNNIYEDLMWVRAKKAVFLGAGSIGTTEILLRSKKLGLSMSDKVGTGMSGNGDILAFGYNTDAEVNAIGRQYPSPYNPVGPTITGVIDCRDQENVLDGFIIEEGTVPKALAPLFQTMLEMMPGNQYPQGYNLFAKVKHVLAQQGSRFLGPYFKKGSIERTQVYLIMSHDSNQAILTLKDDKPVLEFLGVGRSEHVQELNEILKQATEAVGGIFVNSPFYAALGQQEITVHPIGGACMSRDGTGRSGVTNHGGELFTGNSTETYPGLIVTDAAVIPTALGCNPFATITALAERSVELAAVRLLSRGERIDFETKNDILDLFADPHQYDEEKRKLHREDTTTLSAATRVIARTRAMKANGFGFSEVMSGFIHIGDGLDGEKIEDYETAAKTATGLCEGARFFLSVKAWDTAAIVNRSDHPAMLTGTFTCAGLPGSPFMVQRGNFHLFTADQEAPGTRNLTYDFDMTSVNDEIFHFHGFKVVDSSCALGPWRFWTAASTLYVTITHGNKVLGRGMMHIQPSDFLSEIFTLKPSGKNFWARLHSTASFMGFFARQSASLFLAPLTAQEYPAVTYRGYINDSTPDETVKIVASDGVQTLLHVWEPRAPGVETHNLFMIPGASVDHQIFALPTIQVNAVNYFTRAGYRVFVPVHRICMIMLAGDNWTTFDARLDIKASLEWARNEFGKEPIYTICHCMGAVAYSSGLLDGTIPSNWIKGISASQVLFNPIWSTLNMAKVLAGPVPFDKLYKMLGGNWFSCSSGDEDNYFQKLVNQLLRFYPDSREEICNNNSCHRTSLVFGRLWNHRNLNEATHRQINRFFGGVNMTLLHLLMQMGYRGFVTTNGPLFTQLTTPSNIKRLKGIPIMLFSGADNKVLTPESTDKTYTVLRDAFGPDGSKRDDVFNSKSGIKVDAIVGEGHDAQGYERHVIQEYGHLDCWMGRQAYKDVYPLVREQVDRVCRGSKYIFKEPDWETGWENWRALPKSGGRNRKTK